MYVRDILSVKGNDVITVKPDMTALDFAKKLVEERIGAALVLDDDGTVIGVMSERDIVYAVAAHGQTCLDRTVGDMMTKEVKTCQLDTTIDDVMSLMTRRRIRHLPVIEGGKLEGIISIGDVVKNRIAEAEREASQLREYITA